MNRKLKNIMPFVLAFFSLILYLAIYGFRLVEFEQLNLVLVFCASLYWSSIILFFEKREYFQLNIYLLISVFIITVSVLIFKTSEEFLILYKILISIIIALSVVLISFIKIYKKKNLDKNIVEN